MKHPFALESTIELNSAQIGLVNGGLFTQGTLQHKSTSPRDGKAQDRAVGIISPAKPPVFYTQALGEDGGNLPDPGLI